jgi:DNA replicative helicase MCM subunit Mcm2 (Cdc46/Mcm family)
MYEVMHRKILEQQRTISELQLLVDHQQRIIDSHTRAPQEIKHVHEHKIIDSEYYKKMEEVRHYMNNFAAPVSVPKPVPVSGPVPVPVSEPGTTPKCGSISFEDELDNIVRQGSDSILESYYELDSVRYNNDGAEGVADKSDYDKQRMMFAMSAINNVKKGTSVQHDIKIIESPDGTKLICIDGVVLKYSDVATAVSSYTKDAQ